MSDRCRLSWLEAVTGPQKFTRISGTTTFDVLDADYALAQSFALGFTSSNASARAWDGDKFYAGKTTSAYSISRFDASGVLEASNSFPVSPTNLFHFESYLWKGTGGASGLLYKINPTSLAVDATYAITSSTSGVLFYPANGFVWAHRITGGYNFLKILPVDGTITAVPTDQPVDLTTVGQIAVSDDGVYGAFSYSIAGGLWKIAIYALGSPTIINTMDVPLVPAQTYSYTPSGLHFVGSSFRASSSSAGGTIFNWEDFLNDQTASTIAGDLTGTCARLDFT